MLSEEMMLRIDPSVRKEIEADAQRLVDEVTKGFQDALSKECLTKNGAYSERNRLVALLASLFPSGIKRTEIEGWDPEWHGCVYIDLPTGQASWHYHDSDAHLFAHIPPYEGEWDGHTTEQKYERIAKLAASMVAHVRAAGIEVIEITK